MPTVESVSVISRLALIQSVDQKLTQEDPHKLSPRLRGQVDRDLAALEETERVATTSELDRSEKSSAVREGLAKLEELVRDGYRWIAGIRSSQISDEDRAMVFAAYGWTGGLLGRLSDDRIVALARIGCVKDLDVDPAHCYPDSLVTDLENALTGYQKTLPEPGTGFKGGAVLARNETLTAAEQTIAQVRYWYCAASRLTLRNPYLANIGFNPRRKRRSKEDIEATQKRKDEKRREQERKQLERVEQETARSIQRLEEQVERLRTKHEQARKGLQGGPTSTPNQDSDQGRDQTPAPSVSAEESLPG